MGALQPSLETPPKTGAAWTRIEGKKHRTRAHQAAEERGDLKYLLVERQLPFYMLPGEERRYMYTSVTVFSPSMSLDMQYMRKQD